jgi:hypothetical protein
MTTLKARPRLRWLAYLRDSMASLERGEGHPDPLLPRGLERLIVRIFGRPVNCAVCGRRLFVGLPLVWRGELWLLGAYEHVVRVSFASSEAMEFRHAQLDECPAPERPWVA